MPEIHRIRGISIRINIRDEHYPVHVHIVQGSNHYRVYMNCKVDKIKGKFKKKDLEDVFSYIVKNRNKIQKAYTNMMNGKETPKRIG